MRGELYDLQDDQHEWYNRFDDPAYSAVRWEMTMRLVGHLSQAFARAPAHGHYRGLDVLRHREEP